MENKIIGYRLKHKKSKRHYIGITSKPCGQRLSQHLRDNRRNKRTSWIKSHYAEKDLFYMEQIFITNDIDEAKNLEIYWIKKDREEYGYSNILNSTDGGDGVKMRYSPETRLKISLSRIGKTLSPETRLKISNSLKLKDNSFRKGRPSSRKGAVLSEETKLKISTSNMGKHSYPKNGFRPGYTPWNKGIRTGPLSEGHKNKILEGRSGYVHSQETKNKISQSNKKLSTTQIEKIIQMLNDGMFQYKVAKIFKVSQATISGIWINFKTNDAVGKK